MKQLTNLIGSTLMVGFVCLVSVTAAFGQGRVIVKETSPSHYTHTAMDDGSLRALESSRVRAHRVRNNLAKAERELRNNPGIAHTLSARASTLRSDYQVALAANSHLTFANFVTATRLAQNLHPKHSNITRTAILNGLARGDGISKTLKNLGLSSDAARAAKKQAESEIKQSKK